LSQLALPLKLQDHAVFDSFFAAGNDGLVAFLLDISVSGRGPGCYIWGPPASGKTHLLQAVCERIGDESVYLPLGEILEAGAGVLQGLAERQFVCVDDLQLVVGEAAWELALFELWNQIADNSGVLIVASTTPPKDSGIVLADLESRLSRLTVFRSNELDEDDRIKALQLRAKFRGLDLPDETANYLLSRSRRDMKSLYRLLDRLDDEALIAKRRLTIPFVRGVLSGDSPAGRAPTEFQPT
jgi:DnaA family protein